MIACLNQHRFQVWTDNVYYPLWPLYIWHVTCELHVFYQHCSRSYLYAASYGQVIWAYVILPADMSACSTCRGVRCERVSRSAGTAHTHTHVCAQGSMHIPRVCRSARTCAGVCAKIDRRMTKTAIRKLYTWAAILQGFTSQLMSTLDKLVFSQSQINLPSCLCSKLWKMGTVNARWPPWCVWIASVYTASIPLSTQVVLWQWAIFSVWPHRLLWKRDIRCLQIATEAVDLASLLDGEAPILAVYASHLFALDYGLTGWLG